MFLQGQQTRSDHQKNALVLLSGSALAIELLKIPEVLLRPL